jgi:hypothetical protein
MNDEQKAALDELLEAVADIERWKGCTPASLQERSAMRSRWMKATGRVDRAFF